MGHERAESISIRYLRISGLLFFVLITLFPFYWMVVSSLRPLEEILVHPSRLWLSFRDINLNAYYDVIFEHGFSRYILNSLYVSTLTVFLTLFFSSIGGYAATRFSFRGKRLIYSSIVVIYLFPVIVLIIPLYVIFSRLGIRDSLHVLILIYLAQTLPVGLYMMRGHFEALPVEVEQAALIDGCSRLGVLWRIVLPVSLPALASVALYTFMIAWTEFLFAFIFLDSPSKFTLSRGVVHLAGSVHLSKQLVMAASVIITIPVLALFILFERYLVSGLTKGAVKG